MERWVFAQNRSRSRVFVQRRVKVQQAIKFRVIGQIHLTFQFVVLRMKLQVSIQTQVCAGMRIKSNEN